MVFVGKDNTNPITSPQDTRYGQFLSDPRFPSDGSIPDFKDGYQPRLGVSWSPSRDGKTAIRLGAGIYYARIPGLVVAGPRNTDGIVAGNIFFSADLANPPSSIPAAAFPVFPIAQPTQGFNPFDPGVAVFERNFKNPRTIQYSVSIEREIYTDINLLVAYNYAKSTRLTRFVNRADPRLHNDVAVFSGLVAKELPDLVLEKFVLPKALPNRFIKD